MLNQMSISLKKTLFTENWQHKDSKLREMGIKFLVLRQKRELDYRYIILVSLSSLTLEKSGRQFEKKHEPVQEMFD